MHGPLLRQGLLLQHLVRAGAAEGDEWGAARDREAQGCGEGGPKERGVRRKDRYKGYC
jgi:hypothetical protein